VLGKLIFTICERSQVYNFMGGVRFTILWEESDYSLWEESELPFVGGVKYTVIGRSRISVYGRSLFYSYWKESEITACRRSHKYIL
jgi:hypothetical protein